MNKADTEDEEVPSIFEDYQLTQMQELFNIEDIEQTLDRLEDDKFTPQQKSILKFIIDNPEENYIELQDTFKAPDHIVVTLVLQYGTPSEEYNELKELRDELLAKSL